MVEHAREKLALAFDATFFPIEARKKGMKKSLRRFDDYVYSTYFVL